MTARRILFTGVAAFALMGAGEATAAGQWSAAGQFAGAGICAVAVSPSYGSDHTMWAGSTGSGLFASYDGGAHWRRLPVPNPAVGTCVLAFSPAYAADRTAIVVSDQAYITHDAGETWVALTLPVAPSEVAFSPDFPTDHILLAATDQGPIFRSSDAGATWTQVADWQAGLPPAGHFIATRLLLLRRGVALLGTGNGIYRSTDLGENWSWSNQGLPVVVNRDAATGMMFQRTPQVAGIAVGGTSLYTALRRSNSASVYRSLDSGATWTAKSLHVRVVPTDLVVAGEQSGESLMMASADRGVLASDDGGLSWHIVSDGLSDRDVVALQLTPDGKIAVAGAAFDGVFTRMLPSGRWHTRFAGMPETDPSAALLAIRRGTRDVYAGTLSGIFRSSDGGVRWTPDDAGLPQERSVFSFASAPGRSGGYTLLAGTSNGLFAAVDGRGQWRQVGATLMRGLSVNAVTAARQGGRDVVAAGSENGLFLSPDGGVTWRMVVRGDMNIEALRFAGSDLYALCAGRLLRYRGAREIVVSPGLGTEAISAFTVVSGRPTMIYAATTHALYRLVAGKWRRELSFPQALPVLATLPGRRLMVAAGDRVYTGSVQGGRWARATAPGKDEVIALTVTGAYTMLAALADGGIWTFRE